MSKKDYELYDPKRFKVQLEEQGFSKQRNIGLSLPLSIFYSFIDVLSEELRQYLLALQTHKNETLNKLKDGGLVTKHGILKHKIFKRLFIIDRMLKTPHFQEIYNQQWKTFKLKTFNPFVKPGSVEDFQQRYYAIFEILLFLMMNEGVVPYPDEVKRFCDKYRSMHTKKYLKKSGTFLKDMVRIQKEKRQVK